MQTDTAEILAKLVSYPVLGGESNLSILSYIREFLDHHQVSYHLVPNEDESKASLHCRIGPAVSGGTILSGHMDVVPVEGQDWQTDPFKLVDKGDGKLYARGSCDMKGFLACCLSNVHLMKHLQKPIYLAFSYDEEIGCQGAPDLISDINQTYQEKPAYAIIGEPSMLNPVVGQKGICVYTTTVYGSAGHSSRIRQEVSAVHEAARLITWLEDKMEELIASGQVDDRFHPPHTSLHSGKIKGGIAPNVIADRCSFTWDVRSIPSDNQEDIYQAFNAFCEERLAIMRKKFPEAAIETKRFHPPVPPLDTAEHEKVVPFIQELSGKSLTETVSYAAEAGQFAEGGFQSVICGPGSIEQAHRANEYISKEQLDLGADMIKRLVGLSS